MAGSIAEFKSSFKTELARPSRFDVEIPVPLGLSPFLGLSRKMNFRCENTELPGRTLATTSMKIYGPEEKYPYQTTYNDISLTFVVGDDMREKLFLDAWLEWINPTFNFNMKYKNDYCVPIRINQYNLRNKISYSVDLIDAYPVAINPLQLDWSSDGYHKLTATFVYTYWKNNSIEALAMQIAEAGVTNYLTSASGLDGEGSTSGIGIGISNAFEYGLGVILKNSNLADDKIN